jgi:hypothetical protein
MAAQVISQSRHFKLFFQNPGARGDYAKTSN